MIQTMGFICFIDKSFIVLSLECIAGNEGIFPKFPSFLYISNIAGQFSRRIYRFVFSSIKPIYFTIIIPNNRFNSIIFSRISQTCCHALIIISIIVGDFR